MSRVRVALIGALAIGFVSATSSAIAGPLPPRDEGQPEAAPRQAEAVPQPAEAPPSSEPPSSSELPSDPPRGVVPSSWEHGRAESHYGRAALEMSVFLGLGAVWYWLDIDRNLADWDRLSLDQRFTWEAVRLDNNEFFINHVAHPFVGSVYYAFARSNGLNVLEAAAYTKLTSMAWEYGLEFQERTSYNDFFVTPLAGIAFGEAFHSLGLYFNSGRGTPAHDALAWSLGLPTAIHRAMDGISPPRIRRRDALGFDADVAHEFESSYGVGALRTARTDSLRHSWRLSSELLAITDYGTVRPLEHWFVEGVWTQMAVATHFSTEPTGLEFSGHSVLAGVHHQGGGTSVGHAATTGLGLGFDYAVVRATDFKQQFGLLHIVGLYHKGLLRMGELMVELRARISPDFSAVNSLPYERWWESRDPMEPSRGKSILRKQGYYYGWGWSSQVSVDLRWRVLSLGAAAGYSAVDSLSGLDRTQEDLDFEERASDDWDSLRLYARVLAPSAMQHTGTMRGRLRPFAELSVEGIRRRSQLEDLSSRRSVSEKMLRLGLEF